VSPGRAERRFRARGRNYKREVPVSQAFKLLVRITVAVGFVPPVRCGRLAGPSATTTPSSTSLEANARIADSYQIARASRELIRQSLALVQTVLPQRSAGETA